MLYDKSTIKKFLGVFKETIYRCDKKPKKKIITSLLNVIRKIVSYERLARWRLQKKQNSIYSLNSIDIEESLPCEPPVGEIEEELALIWSKVLKIKKIGRHDNFFELGGDFIEGEQNNY